MRIEQLQAFEEIACSKSISIAAQNLFVTQPTLSRSIKALEDELGIALFARFSDGVNLTEEGALLLPYARQILADIHKLTEEAKFLTHFDSINTEENIDFKIYSMQSIADTILFPSLKAMEQSFPQINFIVKVSNTSDPYALPDDIYEYDLFLGTNVFNTYASAIKNSTLKMSTVFYDRFSAVMNRQHPLAIRKIVDIDDILGYPLIFHDYDFTTEAFYQKQLHTYSTKTLNIVLRSNNPRVITNYLKSSNAILSTNNIIAANDFMSDAQLIAIPLKGNQYQVFFLYPPDSPYENLIHQLSALLQKTRKDLSSMSSKKI